jgi:hypothetical protein
MVLGEGGTDGTNGSKALRCIPALLEVARVFTDAKVAPGENIYKPPNPFAQSPSLYLCKRFACDNTKGVLMFYRKNVGATERVARAVAGGLMISCAFTAFAQSPLKWVLLGSGIITLLTGVIGFCPACAMVGRRGSEG